MAVRALILTFNISQCILGRNSVLMSGEVLDLMHKPEQRAASPPALVAPGCKGWRQKQHSGVLGEFHLKPRAPLQIFKADPQAPL